MIDVSAQLAKRGAVEEAARAMCDRVNGIGDYDENISQRRTGWVAQAQAGIAAYHAALPARENGAAVENVLATLRQYIDDMRYPPDSDSRPRRIAAAESAIATLRALSNPHP